MFRSITGLSAAVFILAATCANAAMDYSFTGNLAYDNSVQLFTFTVGADSPNVILRTWSYAGGVNAAGQTIARGGFDPILAVFNSSGQLINQNDDGGYAYVAGDAVTGMPYDTYLILGSLAAGTYTASVSQYDNFANGPYLSDGFRRDGAANQWFRNQWYDVTGNQRDSHWAFDILNVESGVVVPEPSTCIAGALLGLPLMLTGIRRLLKKS